MLTLARRNIATPGRVRMQRTVRPSMRLGLRLRVRRPARLVSLRGGRTRIVRCLRRQVELDAQLQVFLPQRRGLGLKNLQTRCQNVQPLDQRSNKRVFRGAIENGKIRRQNHPYVDSHPTPQRHSLHAIRVNLPHASRLRGVSNYRSGDILGRRRKARSRACSRCRADRAFGEGRGVRRCGQGDVTKRRVGLP